MVPSLTAGTGLTLQPCSPDGVWNRGGAGFAFVIAPPLWRSSGAWSFICWLHCCVAAVVRLVTHRRLRLRLQALEHCQEMSRELMRIAHDMHDEIGSKRARISFLSEDFETDLSDSVAPDRKVDSIASTSRDLLQSLNQMVWAVNPCNDTVEHLVAYLGQYVIEYFQNTSIQCQLQLPHDLPTSPLSADVRHNVLLAVKEVLSNALKHSGAGCVSVDMRAENDFLLIKITDDDSGFDVQRTASLAADGKRAR